MDHAARMGAGERVEHLGHQVARQLPAEAPLARQYLPQRGARHVLEDGVERTVFGFPGVDQAHDVRWESSAQSRISRRKRATWFSTSRAASPCRRRRVLMATAWPVERWRPL